MKQEFPRSARNALARQAAADEHPSADLLNGFVERALGADDNARVSAHLASCADCRDVVFLASAASQDEHPAASAQAAPAAWARWGTWKWLAPALGALAIVSGVLIEHHRNLTAELPASETVAVTTPSSETARPPSAASTMQARNTVPDELKSAGPQRSSDRKREQFQKKTETASRVAPESRALTPSVGITGPKDQNQPELAQASPPPPLAPKAAWPTPEPTAAAKAAVPANAVAQPNGAPLQAASDAARTAKQPMATAGSIGGAGAHKAAGIGSAGVLGATLSANRAAVAAPHWRISADGHLERSTSPGEWTQALSDQPVSFRTVAVIGSQVWAGGSDGALFHSSDAGEHWTQVALIADGQPERGAVQSIRFDTPSQGRVITEAGATWSTTDGGKTWTRQ